MREAQFQQQVIRYLKTVPNLFYVKVSDRFTMGVPDILVCYKGHFIAFELKVGKNKPTQLQYYTLLNISLAGGDAYVVYDLDTIKEALRKYD